MARRAFLAIALVLWLVSLALAGEGRVTGADLSEIRAVINRQIDAFRRDDAQGAFALVSPGVQEAFGTPDKFLETVRMAYRAVYRPSAVQFLDLVLMGDDVVQQVQLTDRSGQIWIAYFAMQRQKDGAWRTNGCHLIQPAKTIPA
jgi:Domain of unknown function (DUF4864)